jgi:ParB family chromosome partitioning protein
MELKLTEIAPDPDQPRKEFDPEKLGELAESIKAHGVIQPIAVRLTPHGYLIVAGERRWRASKLAGRETIPVHILTDQSEQGVREAALIENIQRQDLNPLEEAMALQKLVESAGSVSVVASRIGKSRPAVANAIRVLSLPQPCLQAMSDGTLSRAHAILLLQLRDPPDQISVCEQVVRYEMTTKELARYLSDIGAMKSPGHEPEKDGKSFAPAVGRTSSRFSEVVCPECFHEFEII